MTGPNPIAGHNGRTQRTDQSAANGKSSRHRTTTHRDYRQAIGRGNVKTIRVTGLNESHTHTHPGSWKHRRLCRGRTHSDQIQFDRAAFSLWVSRPGKIRGVRRSEVHEEERGGALSVLRHLFNPITARWPRLSCHSYDFNINNEAAAHTL